MSISAAMSVSATPFISSQYWHSGPGSNEVRDLMGTAHSVHPVNNQFAHNLFHPLECSLPANHREIGDRIMEGDKHTSPEWELGNH